MHKANIETVREEAKRQLDILKGLLKDALKENLVAAPAKNDNDRATFDTESLQKTLDILDNESEKLINLDMVLAVVGTMKAGKSTSINAIVGTEVLPNRNRPMTTLPTLIRHTPEVSVPRLILPKVEPINDLLKKLEAALYSKSGDVDKRALEEISRDKDMAELLDRIKDRNIFLKEYKGEEEIFNFLKKLNDLARMCFRLKVDFPFKEYASFDSMPVIEVEFSHLKGMSNTQGRLSLMDTPGPNEAGQQHLRGVLSEQLRSASAVLAVLDYTQLKSDADDNVRRSLLDIADTTKDRMYVLVNKFDQRGRNDDGEKETKAVVAKTLMEEKVSEDRVFPISSLRGYLANRARNVLHRGGLPDHKTNTWVEDFCNQALGASWDSDDLENIEHLKGVAEKLWKKSGFSQPLEKVIAEAHRHAALDALRSATTKVKKYTEDAGDFFKANVGALQKSTADLEKTIHDLQHDIEKIQKLEKEASAQLDGSLEAMRREVGLATERARGDILGELDRYFKEGCTINKKNASEKGEAAKSGHTIFGDMFFGGWVESKSRQSQDERDFDPNSPVVKFDEKSVADEFSGRIKKSIDNVFLSTESSLEKVVDKEITHFIDNFECEQSNLIVKIEKSVNKTLDGFDISIKSPKMKGFFSGNQFSRVIDEAVAEKTKSVTRYRRQTGVWGTFCRWLGTDDLGWESYQASEDYYEVDIEKIKKSANIEIDKFFQTVKAALDSNIYPHLKYGVDQFYDAFRGKVQDVRGDLLENIKRHALEQYQKDAILKVSRKMTQEALLLREDAETTSEVAENLRCESVR